MRFSKRPVAPHNSQGDDSRRDPHRWTDSVERAAGRVANDAQPVILPI
jgi:hypothetical protein